MVDVSAKAVTAREAVAESRVRVSAALAKAIASNGVKKGDVLGVARLAGVLGAKRTSELIPLCHGLPLEHAGVEVELVGREVRIVATARTTWKTGVEMEALTAAAVAALTVIDMGKAIDKEMEITSVRVLEKRGGRSGEWVAPRRARRKNGG